jgi:DNA-binding LytR/AlgR family response regulator
MRIAIVDDMKSDQAVLENLLVRTLKKYKIPLAVEVYDSAEAFLAVFEKERFDLCFMDIYLDGMNGMEAAREVAAKDPGCMIIFLTTSAEFMAEGYDVRAWRYIIKPIDEERLDAIMPQCIAEAELKKRRLRIHYKGRDREIPYGKITYVVRVNRNTEIHFIKDKVILPAAVSFGDTVEPLLADDRFVLSCKGVVVNLDHVKSLAGSDFIMENGDKLPISQRRLAQVNDAFIDYSFEHF